MFIAFACVYWLLMNLRFVQWVYLWEKLCERIRDLCLSFEKWLLKISIIWICDCTCVASDDAYASVICFWWCMLLMHESIVGKETETTDFFWRVLLSNYLVFDCCWFWVGCHVGRIKARARFWSISLWNPKKLLSQLAWMSSFGAAVSEMFTWGHYLSILLQLVAWEKRLNINTCFPSLRCIWNTFM